MQIMQLLNYANYAISDSILTTIINYRSYTDVFSSESKLKLLSKTKYRQCLIALRRHKF